ncbi:hypothetical protein HPP92_026278 [Vanilla planifolia]|uniref:Uncharacterized protein n=1 Tax=Vanilla planifolia TaxID=51239 RepID=A0A835PFS0_VANPL|nr:hypothetical protein HPP92_026278 [Vanilla planifolia]KAG0457812.1 hypothetical protein HPP92_022969 [Vanilla planifolia]
MVGKKLDQLHRSALPLPRLLHGGELRKERCGIGNSHGRLLWTRCRRHGADTWIAHP